MGSGSEGSRSGIHFSESELVNRAASASIRLRSLHGDYRGIGFRIYLRLMFPLSCEQCLRDAQKNGWENGGERWK